MFVDAGFADAGRALGLAAVIGLLSAVPADAVDIAPHRALYSMSLGTAKSSSGVVGASGTMSYEWGETCDGWTIEQRYKLRIQYDGQDETEISSNYVTWESKDGLRYRFNERKFRNGDLDEEIRGEARLTGPGKGGVATFTKPSESTLDLSGDVIFPTAHTILLIERAAAGDEFVGQKVFDGTGEDRAVEISAVIGGAQAAGTAPTDLKSPLLGRPSWRVRLAFFPLDSKDDKPEYELGMRLLDNGVSRDMVLDYGDFSVKAKLDELEALPKPKC